MEGTGKVSTSGLILFESVVSVGDLQAVQDLLLSQNTLISCFALVKGVGWGGWGAREGR